MTPTDQCQQRIPVRTSVLPILCRNGTPVMHGMDSHAQRQSQEIRAQQTIVNMSSKFWFERTQSNTADDAYDVFIRLVK